MVLFLRRAANKRLFLCADAHPVKIQTARVPVAEYSMPQFVLSDLDPLWLRVLCHRHPAMGVASAGKTLNIKAGFDIFITRRPRPSSTQGVSPEPVSEGVIFSSVPKHVRTKRKFQTLDMNFWKSSTAKQVLQSFLCGYLHTREA